MERQLLDRRNKRGDYIQNAFATPKRLFECNRMSFDLVNSCSTYQRLIEETLRPIEHADTYIDVCVYSNGFDNHLSELENTLKSFRKALIQLRRDKCTFGYFQGEFLGHVVSREGHTQSSRLVDKIRNAATPNLRSIF